MPPKRNKHPRPNVSPYARIDELERKFRGEKETRRDAEADLERVLEELGETEDQCNNLQHSLDAVLEIVNRLRSEAHGTDYTSVEDFIFDQLPEELKRCKKCNTILNQFKPEIKCKVCNTPF